jgi:acyl-CoA oxidase
MFQETATTCRERCGGQGYLSCNRFGQLIGFAHAGMTAEGDNRVLMQKVAKELLSCTHLPAVKARLQVVLLLRATSPQSDRINHCAWSRMTYLECSFALESCYLCLSFDSMAAHSAHKCKLQAGSRPPRPWQAAEAALRSAEYLRALFATREGRLLALLGSAVAGSGVQPSKDEQFDTWMKQESDLVQVWAKFSCTFSRGQLLAYRHLWTAAHLRAMHSSALDKVQASRSWRL